MSDFRYFDRSEERLAHEWPWLVDLICCGHDDGIEACATWTQADGFRESYCTGGGVASHYTRPDEGHVRSAIVRRSDLTPWGRSGS